MKIVLWGYYGINYGDDMMLESILYYCKKNSVSMILVDLFSGMLKYKYSYEKIDIFDFYKLSRIQRLKFLRKVSDKKNYINIWGGGTIFTDEDGDGNFGPFSKILFLGGKVGYICVGIGHLNNKVRKLKTKWLLKGSKLVTFRDSESLQRAKILVGENQRLFLVEDLVYYYIKTQIGQKSFKRNVIKEKYLLITWRNLDGYLPFNIESNLMDIVVDCILYMYRNVQVVLSALDKSCDIDSCRLLFFKLKKRGINVSFDIDNTIGHITKLISNASVHFSGRLHGSMVSEILGTKTISLNYSPKMDYFYKSIGSDSYIDIYKKGIQQKILELLRRSDHTNINLEKKASKAALNFKYLIRQLD